MTPLQMHMYYYVKNMLRDNGVSPTYKEIQEEFGLSSISKTFFPSSKADFVVASPDGPPPITHTSGNR